LRIPGPQPDLFARAAIQLQANARLDDPARPVEFSVHHALLAAEGRATTAGDPSGTLKVTIAALAPFAHAAGVDVAGSSTIAVRAVTKDDVTRLDVDGALGVTGGMAPLPALIGKDAKLALSAVLRADGLTLQRAQLDGRTLRLAASGTRRGDAIDFKWNAALSDLAALTPALKGALSAEGRARGTLNEFAADVQARGDVGTREFPPERIEAHATAKGLPAAPSGTIHARGRLLGAPLELATNLQHERDGTLRVTIDRADWKSAHADGQVTLSAEERVPRGRVALRMARLDDLQALVGQALQGSITANVEFVPQGAASDAIVQLDARSIGVPDAAAERVTLSGRCRLVRLQRCNSSPMALPRRA
jgi:translocation and assembly module TamB